MNIKKEEVWDVLGKRICLVLGMVIMRKKEA